MTHVWLFSSLARKDLGRKWKLDLSTYLTVPTIPADVGLDIDPVSLFFFIMDLYNNKFITCTVTDNTHSKQRSPSNGTVNLSKNYWPTQSLFINPQTALCRIKIRVLVTHFLKVYSAVHRCNQLSQLRTSSTFLKVTGIARARIALSGGYDSVLSLCSYSTAGLSGRKLPRKTVEFQHQMVHFEHI